MALTARRGYLPGRGLIEVTIRDDLIDTVTDLDPTTGWHEDLAAGGLLLPGLVDLQVNGFDRHDLNSGELDEGTVVDLVASLHSHGVTAFCPTLITAPIATLCDSLQVIDRVRSRGGELAVSLLGAHLEGPWLSPREGARGAHPVEHLCEADAGQLRRLLNAGMVSVLTVAPEVDGVIDVVRAAVGAGVTVSLGHSAAEAADVRAGVAAGATLSTHLGNGVPALLPRHPNLVWEQLAEDRLTAMFIADLHHVDPTTLRAMLRAKGAERLVLVSDSTALGGRPPGRYTTHIGGEVELSADGRLSVFGTPYLAGAAMSLLSGLSNVLKHGLLSPADAVAAATRGPRQALGADVPTDLIAPGSPADLVLGCWDPAGRTAVATETLIAGKIVWSA